jgi:ketosteroid isomerase-like protein
VGKSDLDMQVSTYGSTAVVTGVENLKGTYKGRSGEMALRFTNVLVWRDGRWQLVSHQSTRVQSK